MWQYIIPAIASVVNTAQVNRQNASSVASSNAANVALAEKANRFAKSESELAYKRSLPTTQTSNLMAAGMSRAGAINAINGGGHYTPAPVNTAQVQPAQAQTADLSSLANIAQIMSAEKLQNSQLKAQAEENAKNRKSAENIARINADAQKYGVDTSANVAKENRDLEREKYLGELQLRKDDLTFRKEQYNYGKKLVDAQTGLTNYQKERVKAELDDFRSKPATDAREAEHQMRQMASLYNYRIHENDFYKYLVSNYTIDDSGNYVPTSKNRLGTLDQGVEGNFSSTEQLAKAFWDMMFSIIPIKPLLESIKLFAQ